MMIHGLEVATLLITMSAAEVAKPQCSHAITSLTLQWPGDAPFPEGVLIRGNQIVVSAPAAWNSGASHSSLLLFDGTSGAFEGEIALSGELPGVPPAVSGIAYDREGRVFALSTQLGIVRVNLHTGEQEIYSDLGGGSVLPNDITFDTQGRAYVSDTVLGVIWRVDAQRNVEAWLFDEGVASLQFGFNGLRITPDGEHLVVAVTGSLDATVPGRIYQVALDDPSTLVPVWEYGVTDGPDDLAFGASGKLYVSLALANAISVLDLSDPANVQETRYESDLLHNPAGLYFDDRSKSLLIANHALLEPNQGFAVLRFMACERGLPLFEPLP